MEAVYSVCEGSSGWVGGFLVGVLEMFDLISVFYIFIIKIKLKRPSGSVCWVFFLFCFFNATSCTL